MFEAHNLYADEFLPAVNAVSESAANATLPEALHLLHSHYHCPLYVWFARGIRKNRQGQRSPTLFIQVEYRHADGTPGWTQLQQPGTTLDEDIWQQLAELTLPALCPQQTRNNPIGC